MIYRPPIFAALLVLAGCLFVTAHDAPAQNLVRGPGVGPSGTTLGVRVGWDGWVRAARWSPVYLTLSDPTPRNVTLEFRAPHGSFYGMKSRQVLTIGPTPQTFIVYMPLRQFMPEDLSFIVRDATTRRRLADYPGGVFVSFAGGMDVPWGHSFLGISGRRATLAPVTNALPGAQLSAGHIESAELPTSAIGYDCLDVLVLNAPDFSALLSEQQQAIVEWVRAGGNLLLWPGDLPVPDSGALVDALPCRIADTTVIELLPDELKTAGLTARFAKLPARELRPAAGAEPITLLGVERVRAFRGRLGLGQVIVCPIDLASLQMDSPQKTWGLWRVVLKPMIRRLPEDGVATPEQRYEYGSQPSQREATALRQVGDMLGSIPGAGQFGFGYVAGVLIGMMVIVGPVDWLVLKKLGRQPWTWATTTGWIALVTLSAVYAGHLFKSGELHYRTFQLVDQADGVAVARTELAALYSPRTTDYTLTPPPDGWWQPASPGDEFYGYRRSGREIAYAQTYRGSTPDPMAVNVWNLRFVAGESTTASPPVVEARLRLEQREVGGRPQKYLVGTITNVGPEPLANIAVRTRAGWARLFDPAGETRPAEPMRVAPGQTVDVNALIEAAPAAASAEELRQARNPYYGQNVAQIDRSRLWDNGGDLSMRRTDRIEQWVGERDDLACVYGECEGPAPTIELKEGPAIQQHWKVVRALVPLGEELNPR